jgi:hypothetical protein
VVVVVAVLTEGRGWGHDLAFDLFVCLMVM